jgi:mRNA interferase RelE/StbE
MAWKIELSGLAQTNLRASDDQNAVRILRFLRDRVAALDDPRGIGEALKGSLLGGFWKYSVSDDRIIASIEDAAVRVLVVRLGDRRDAYRR